VRFLYMVLLSIIVSPVASAYTGTPWASTGTCVQHGVVSFSFDDGISKYNDYLLDILDREGIKAGFFIVGDTLYTKKRREGLTKIHERGHLVFNHTYSHPDLTRLSYSRLVSELTKTEDLIIKYTGSVPYKLIRPPFGKINTQTLNRLKKLGYSIALWNLDSNDWDYTRSKKELWDVYVNMFRGADPKKRSFIILQHDRRLDSIELIPDIARLAKARGFKIVSFEECFGLDF
jgi:peptidoglycan/xylan/chitin deacetylase (PgdA/CDA1 family)